MVAEDLRRALAPLVGRLGACQGGAQRSDERGARLDAGEDAPNVRLGENLSEDIGVGAAHWRDQQIGRAFNSSGVLQAGLNARGVRLPPPPTISSCRAMAVAGACLRMIAALRYAVPFPLKEHGNAKRSGLPVHYCTRARSTLNWRLT